MLMQEVDVSSCLHEVVECFIFLKDQLRFYKLEKVATRNVFHDQVNLPDVFEHHVDSNDVLVL